MSSGMPSNAESPVFDGRRNMACKTAEQGLSVVLEGEELGGEFRNEWHPCKERGGGFVGVYHDLC